MKILHFWKPVLWLAVICYGLFIPASELPNNPFINIPYFDKIVHFSLFFGLNILLLKPFKKMNYNYYLWAPLISVSLGLLLEYSQHFFTNSRSSDLYDFLANAAGVVAATIFYYFFVSGKKLEILF